ncbi:MAG TPA: radical SAM family heme chaperone HemW [Elusimicrobiales bacterium]|nr:radical SAM family heme chaperone HemW [Elusimicrobiales bacterium]
MEGLYIHVPFCSGKCGYCSFVSFACGQRQRARYLAALEREMSFFAGREPDTLYIGGGTPSELQQEQLKTLCLCISRNFRPVSDFSESTFEANPESLDRAKIMLLRQFGFNRISMGLQAAQDRLLAALGRRHDCAQFLRVYEDLREVGFKNINVDLIAGIPDQTEKDLNESLDFLLRLAPEHVSVYALEIEQGTEFERRNVDNRPDFSRLLLETARSRLREAGYRHYEISNFAKPGHECLHNINYWDNGEYVGLGCSAASHISGIRKTNGPVLELYCDFLEDEQGRNSFSCVEKLEGKEKLGETVMLGLRRLDGMPLSAALLSEFGKDFRELQEEGLLVLENGTARLSNDAIYVSNSVFRRFVPPFE